MDELHGNEYIMAAASYLLWFVTGIFFLITEKESTFIRFHAMQSILFFAPVFVLNYVLGFIPFVSWMVGVPMNLIAFIYWILFMWKAYQGEQYKFPIIGNLAEQQLKKMSS
jgi:uncharacterized membrane protein